MQLCLLHHIYIYDVAAVENRTHRWHVIWFLRYWHIVLPEGGTYVGGLVNFASTVVFFFTLDISG